MGREHDEKNLPLVKPELHTLPRGPKAGSDRYLSPYAGPAPAQSDPSYLGCMSAPRRPLSPGVISENARVQYIFDVLQSEALILDPNREPGDEPLSRATPVYFPQSLSSNEALALAPTYLNSRFLAPERYAGGPQGLGPYYVYNTVQLGYGIMVKKSDGPVWLGRDKVLVKRQPKAPVPVTVATRGKSPTNKTTYTRRRAPKRIKVEDQAETSPTTRGGSGRGRGGRGTGRPRGRPRLRRD
jgi:hypothetical protein